MTSLDSVRPEWFGAIGNSTADDTTAMQAAIDAALARKKPLLLGAADYKVTAKLARTLAANQTLSIRGQGEDVSHLTWDCDDGGLDISYQPDGWWHRTPSLAGNVFHISGVSLMTRRVAGASGTALRINGACLDGRPLPPTTTSHVRLRGATGTVPAEWGVGLNLHQLSNSTHDALSFIGANGQRNSIAIDVTAGGDATADPVLNKFINASATFAKVALRASDHAEGIHLANLSAVGVEKGIEWRSTIPESQVTMTSSHIDADECAIDLDGVFDSQIVGNLLFCKGDGIIISDGGYNCVVGNTIRGASGVGSSGVRVRRDGAWHPAWKNIINGNYISGFASGIEATAGVTGVVLGPHAFYNNGTDIVAAPGSTESWP